MGRSSLRSMQRDLELPRELTGSWVAAFGSRTHSATDSQCYKSDPQRTAAKLANLLPLGDLDAAS